MREGSGTPTARDVGSSELRMSHDGAHELVVDLGVWRDVALRVGVDVPGAQLVQRRGLFVREVQRVPVAVRRGLRERLFEHVGQVLRGATGVGLAKAATLKALAKARLQPADLDCIVYCTCTPDHFEPGNGVFLQRELGLSDIPAVDVRNQCSGFLYGLSIADAWIRTGQYRTVLLVGAEVHSRGLDKTTRGRDTAVLFGDGAGVAILGPTVDDGRGVLSTHLYADGRHAEKLWVDAPGLAHDPFISAELIEEGKHR